MSDSPDKFSVAGIFSEAAKEFGSPDRGFIRTTWLLFKSPGHTLRRIFEDEEKDLTTPFRYFLIAYTIYAILSLATGAMDLYVDHQVAQMKLQYAQHKDSFMSTMTDEDLRKATGLSYYLQYPLIATLIYTLITWVASLVTFFKYPITIGQRLSASMYLMGATSILQLPFIGLVFAGQFGLVTLASTLILLLYLVWAVMTFDPKRKIQGFFRGLVWFFLSMLLNAMLISAFTIATTFDDAMEYYKKEKTAEETSTAS
jgi:hypothetical protein